MRRGPTDLAPSPLAGEGRPGMTGVGAGRTGRGRAVGWSLLPSFPPPLPSFHKSPFRPSRKSPFCHSRKFLAGIHPTARLPFSLAAPGPALTGCPITVVPDVCSRGTFRHDREKPASPVLPAAPSVIPQVSLPSFPQVFSGNPERKTFYLLFPTLFGRYAQNDSADFSERPTREESFRNCY